ncbi:MAG: hypothetical protein QG565_855 [Campylobacterota bacterium]|nr:hypothetical protein [Campylobacterota bacterium]
MILFIVFLFLQNGIYLEDTSFQNVKIKKLYIKWDEKISLIAKEIQISEKKNDREAQDDYEKNIKTIKENLPYLNWFKEVTLEKIVYNDITATLHYIENSSGFLNVSSSDFTINAKLSSGAGLLHLKIDDFLLTNKNTKIHGDAIFSLDKKLELTSTLFIEIGDETKLKLYANADKEKLFYEIETDKDIKDTREIVDLFNVDPRTKYWMYDAPKASSLSLNRLYGWVEYKNIDEAYLNLHVKATAHDLTYVYDKKVDAVRTKSTELEFKEGVLYIRPQDAYSYGFFLDKSWLKIDFTKKEELLTLYLLFKGQANKDLLYLLDRYGIKLPFTQTKGEMDTNLKLDINLISSDVEAIGDFYAQEAQINYLGLDIDILDARIAINNSNVKVENMRAKYSDIASAHVDLDFRANESKGELVFRFDEINSKENNLALLNGENPLVAVYNISTEQDYLEIEKSQWKFKDETLRVDAMKIPFNIENISAKIPPTKIKSEKSLSVVVFGDLLFKQKKANLDINLLSLNLMGIELEKSKPRLNLLYDEERLFISSKNLVRLKTDGSKFTINNIAAEASQNVFRVKNLALKYEESLSATISSEYSSMDSIGFVKINDLKYIDASLGEIFKNEENIEFLLQNKENKVFISSKNHDFEYTFWNEEWKLSVNSIDKIALHSKILTDYNLTNGSFEISKTKDEKNAKFSLKTDYQYKVLATKESPMESYFINGEIDTKTKDIFLKINDVVDVEIKDDIKIKANDIGINLHEIASFFNDRNSSSDENSTTKVFVDTQNCFIFISENRHVISDTINFRYLDKVLSGELSHKQGKAVFNLQDGAFHLYGENFNDEFMERLFYLSKFKGGSLEFYINGPIDEYEGMIYVKDTTILDYKILNNILAFVNTVPSLVTFSLPGYNKNGIAAKNAYVNFKLKDDVYNISDIYLKSKEIEIAGLGEASIEKNTIDLDLNLITGLGSSFSKIPLLGHILMGKENVSTTLKVTGKLDDPDIDTQIAKDIAVAPFNIIKRTFMLPFELFKDEENE